MARLINLFVKNNGTIGSELWHDIYGSLPQSPLIKELNKIIIRST